MPQGRFHAEELYQVVGMLREWLLQHRPDAILASDQNFLWEEGDSDRRLAPDILISLEVRHRASESYKLWEERVPDFVMEMLSPSTMAKDLGDKYELYQRLRIQEYWLVDPLQLRLADRIQGHRLLANRYVAVRPLVGTNRHPSEVLPLDFRVENNRVSIHDRITGKDLERHSDVRIRADEAERQRDEAQRQRDEAQRQRDEAQEEIARLKRELQAKGS